MNIYGIGLIGQRSKFNKKIQQLESTPSIIEIFQLFNYFTGRATTERWSWVEENRLGRWKRGEPRFDPRLLPRPSSRAR